MDVAWIGYSDIPSCEVALNHRELAHYVVSAKQNTSVSLAAADILHFGFPWGQTISFNLDDLLHKYGRVPTVVRATAKTNLAPARTEVGPNRLLPNRREARSPGRSPMLLAIFNGDSVLFQAGLYTAHMAGYGDGVRCALVVGGRGFGRRQTGNPVRIRDGPAAVIEHNREAFCKMPLPAPLGLVASATSRGKPGEKACFATARKSEDLPTRGMWFAARDGCRERFI
jgi:hypothetical protein